MGWKHHHSNNGNPCHGCTERHLHCHSECEKYIFWQQGHIEFKRQQYEQKSIDALINTGESRRIHEIKNGQKSKGLGRNKK